MGQITNENPYNKTLDVKINMELKNSDININAKKQDVLISNIDQLLSTMINNICKTMEKNKHDEILIRNNVKSLLEETKDAVSKVSAINSIV